MFNMVLELESNLLKLIKRFEESKLENETLKTQLFEKDSLILNQNLELKNLKNHIDSVKITNSLLGSDEYKRDTKLKINTLIREIDNCIVQLSN